MTTLSERIRWVMREFELSQSALARICGVRQPSVNRWVNDGIDQMNAEAALRLCQRYPISIQWLVTGDGEPLFDGDAVKKRSSVPVVGTCRIRIFQPVAETDPRLEPKLEPLGMAEKIYTDTWLAERNLQAENLRVLLVPDDSMSPFLQKNDCVTVNTADKQVESDHVYAFVYEGELRVRRLRKLMGGAIQSVCDGDWPDEIIKNENLTFLHIIGRVVDHSGTFGL